MTAQQTILPKEPVEAALEAIKRFDEMFRDVCTTCETKAEGLVRRLKEFPSLVLQSGLIPALTFYLSKIDEKKKQEAYSLTVKVVLNLPIDGNRRAVCRGMRGEGEGYPQAIGLLISYIGLQADCKPEELDEIGAKLVECIKKIKAKGVSLERLAEAYATELKKLATAIYQ